MSPRKEVPTLRKTVESLLITNIKNIKEVHKNSECSCTKGNDELLEYQDPTETESRSDCPKIVEVVDSIISYIPPDQLKREISEYFNVKCYKSYVPIARNSLGYNIMVLIADMSKVGAFSPRIAKLIEEFGLVSIQNTSNELLKHVLPLRNDFIILDLMFAPVSDEILEMIGKCCAHLQELRGLLIDECPILGMKKMLFSDSEFSSKRKICNSLRKASVHISRKWINMEQSKRFEVCEKWYLLLSNCPDLQLDAINSGDILMHLHNTKNYLHTKVESICYGDVTDEKLLLISKTYPDVKEIQIFDVKEDIPSLSQFSKITSLDIYGCYFRVVEPFLRRHGQLIRKLTVGCKNDEVNLSLLSYYCPNLTDLYTIAGYYELLDNDETSFRYLEDLTLETEGVNESATYWFLDFLAKIPNLKKLYINLHVKDVITPTWVDDAISKSYFQNLEEIHLAPITLLNMNDFKRWIYACPKLRAFSGFSKRPFSRIALNEWPELESEIQNQNYNLSISFFYPDNI